MHVILAQRSYESCLYYSNFHICAAEVSMLILLGTSLLLALQGASGLNAFCPRARVSHFSKDPIRASENKI